MWYLKIFHGSLIGFGSVNKFYISNKPMVDREQSVSSWSSTVTWLFHVPAIWFDFFVIPHTHFCIIQLQAMCLLSNFCNNNNSKATGKETSFKHLQTKKKQQVLPMTGMEDQAIIDSQKNIGRCYCLLKWSQCSTRKGYSGNCFYMQLILI